MITTIIASGTLLELLFIHAHVVGGQRSCGVCGHTCYYYKIVKFYLWCVYTYIWSSILQHYSPAVSKHPLVEVAVNAVLFYGSNNFIKFFKLVR